MEEPSSKASVMPYVSHGPLITLWAEDLSYVGVTKASFVNLFVKKTLFFLYIFLLYKIVVYLFKFQ